MRSTLPILLLASSVTSCVAQKLPSKPAVITTMELANSYFMKKWPDTKKDIFVGHFFISSHTYNKDWPLLKGEK